MQAVVTMLRNASKSLGCPLMEGKTGPVDSALAKELVRLGVAVEIEPPKEIRGVPNAPQIMAGVPSESASPEKQDDPTADKPKRNK